MVEEYYYQRMGKAQPKKDMYELAREMPRPSRMTRCRSGSVLVSILFVPWSAWTGVVSSVLHVASLLGVVSPRPLASFLDTAHRLGPSLM
jgi:hypothetical protein